MLWEKKSNQTYIHTHKQGEQKKKKLLLVELLWNYQKYENRVTTDHRTKNKETVFHFFAPKELNITEIQESETRVRCKQQRLFEFFQIWKWNIKKKRIKKYSPRKRYIIQRGVCFTVKRSCRKKRLKSLRTYCLFNGETLHTQHSLVSLSSGLQDKRMISMISAYTVIIYSIL